jgi:hypothetical protein
MRGIKVVAHTSIEVEVKRKKPMTQLFQETKKKKRDRKDSNLRGQSPHDF